MDVVQEYPMKLAPTIKKCNGRPFPLCSLKYMLEHDLKQAIGRCSESSVIKLTQPLKAQSVYDALCGITDSDEGLNLCIMNNGIKLDVLNECDIGTFSNACRSFLDRQDIVLLPVFDPDERDELFAKFQHKQNVSNFLKFAPDDDRRDNVKELFCEEFFHLIRKMSKDKLPNGLTAAKVLTVLAFSEERVNNVLTAIHYSFSRCLSYTLDTPLKYLVFQLLSTLNVLDVREAENARVRLLRQGDKPDELYIDGDHQKFRNTDNGIHFICNRIPGGFLAKMMSILEESKAPQRGVIPVRQMIQKLLYHFVSESHQNNNVSRNKMDALVRAITADGGHEFIFYVKDQTDAGKQVYMGRPFVTTASNARSQSLRWSFSLQDVCEMTNHTLQIEDAELGVNFQLHTATNQCNRLSRVMMVCFRNSCSKMIPNVNCSEGDTRLVKSCDERFPSTEALIDHLTACHNFDKDTAASLYTLEAFDAMFSNHTEIANEIAFIEKHGFDTMTVSDFMLCPDLVGKAIEFISMLFNNDCTADTMMATMEKNRQVVRRLYEKSGKLQAEQLNHRSLRAIEQQTQLYCHVLSNFMYPREELGVIIGKLKEGVRGKYDVNRQVENEKQRSARNLQEKNKEMHDLNLLQGLLERLNRDYSTTEYAYYEGTNTLSAFARASIAETTMNAADAIEKMVPLKTPFLNRDMENRIKLAKQMADVPTFSTLDSEWKDGKHSFVPNMSYRREMDEPLVSNEHARAMTASQIREQENELARTSHKRLGDQHETTHAIKRTKTSDTSSGEDAEPVVIGPMEATDMPYAERDDVRLKALKVKNDVESIEHVPPKVVTDPYPLTSDDVSGKVSDVTLSACKRKREAADEDPGDACHVDEVTTETKTIVETVAKKMKVGDTTGEVDVKKEMTVTVVTSSKSVVSGTSADTNETSERAELDAGTAVRDDSGDKKEEQQERTTVDDKAVVGVFQSGDSSPAVADLSKSSDAHLEDDVQFVKAVVSTSGYQHARPEFTSEQSDILSAADGKLSCEIIYRALHIFKKQLQKAGRNDIAGLEHTTRGTYGKFSTVAEGEKFVQVIHVNDDHWVVLTNITSKDSRIVHVFDNEVCRSGVISDDTMLQALCITWRLDIVVRLQHLNLQARNLGQNNCGVFAIAFVNALLNGEHPSGLLFYKPAIMRKKLSEFLSDDSEDERNIPCLKLYVHAENRCRVLAGANMSKAERVADDSYSSVQEVRDMLVTIENTRTAKKEQRSRGKEQEERNRVGKEEMRKGNGTDEPSTSVSGIEEPPPDAIESNESLSSSSESNEPSEPKESKESKTEIREEIDIRVSTPGVPGVPDETRHCMSETIADDACLVSETTDPIEVGLLSHLDDHVKTMLRDTRPELDILRAAGTLPPLKDIKITADDLFHPDSIVNRNKSKQCGPLSQSSFFQIYNKKGTPDNKAGASNYIQEHGNTDIPKMESGDTSFYVKSRVDFFNYLKTDGEIEVAFLPHISGEGKTKGSIIHQMGLPDTMRRRITKRIANGEKLIELDTTVPGAPSVKLVVFSYSIDSVRDENKEKRARKCMDLFAELDGSFRSYIKEQNLQSVAIAVEPVWLHIGYLLRSLQVNGAKKVVLAANYQSSVDSVIVTNLASKVRANCGKRTDPRCIGFTSNEMVPLDIIMGMYLSEVLDGVADKVIDIKNSNQSNSNQAEAIDSLVVVMADTLSKVMTKALHCVYFFSTVGYYALEGAIRAHVSSELDGLFKETAVAGDLEYSLLSSTWAAWTGIKNLCMNGNGRLNALYAIRHHRTEDYGCLTLNVLEKSYEPSDTDSEARQVFLEGGSLLEHLRKLLSQNISCPIDDLDKETFAPRIGFHTNAQQDGDRRDTLLSMAMDSLTCAVCHGNMQFGSVKALDCIKTTKATTMSDLFHCIEEHFAENACDDFTDAERVQIILPKIKQQTVQKTLETLHGLHWSHVSCCVPLDIADGFVRWSRDRAAGGISTSRCRVCTTGSQEVVNIPHIITLFGKAVKYLCTATRDVSMNRHTLRPFVAAFDNPYVNSQLSAFCMAAQLYMGQVYARAPVHIQADLLSKKQWTILMMGIFQQNVGAKQLHADTFPKKKRHHPSTSRLLKPFLLHEWIRGESTVRIALKKEPSQLAEYFSGFGRSEEEEEGETIASNKRFQVLVLKSKKGEDREKIRSPPPLETISRKCGIKDCPLCPRLQETDTLLALEIPRPTGDKNWFDCNSTNVLFAVMSNYGTPKMRYNILYSRGPLCRTVFNLPDKLINIAPDWCILPFFEFTTSAHEVCESDVTTETVKASSIIAQQIATLETMKAHLLAQDQEQKEKEKEGRAKTQLDKAATESSTTHDTPTKKDAKTDRGESKDTDKNKKRKTPKTPAKNTEKNSQDDKTRDKKKYLLSKLG